MGELACTMSASSVMVCALAMMVVVYADEQWNPISGLETKYTTVKAAAEHNTVIVTKGDKVTVHATGIVKQTMKKFWSTKDAGQQAFTYDAGVGKVITGWDQGLLGARIGETRKLDIPAKEGYGERGFPAWGIPPGGGLLFEIEVLSINNNKGKAEL